MHAIMAATAGNATGQAPEMPLKPVRIIRTNEMKSIHRKTNRTIFTTRLTNSE